MKTAILNFGYAEDAMVSQVTMSTYHLTGGQEADTIQEAMESLAMDFYHYHLNMILDKAGESSYSDFFHHCKQLARAHSDIAWWDEYWENIDAPNPIWSPYWAAQTLPDLRSGNFIYIPEQAEEVLLDLILQKNPNAFKERGDALPKPSNVSFSDADLGISFRIPCPWRSK